MLYLYDNIRYDDPSAQRLLSAAEETRTRTALTLVAWPLARVLAIHIVEAVLAERARHPAERGPACTPCLARVSAGN